MVSSAYMEVHMNITGLGGRESYHRLDLQQRRDPNQYCTMAQKVYSKGIIY